MCDEVVPGEILPDVLDRIAAEFTASNGRSISANRRTLRVAREPFDLFRRYCATYAREQAYCCFDPMLVSSLERHWKAAARKL